MHRLIMNSSTYRLASNFATPTHLEKDPANRYLWRMNRRRLEAEAIWDSVHSTAGTLNLQVGGRPVVPPLAEDEIAALRERWHWPVSADPAQHTRRGMYILVRRNFPFPMFEVFDAPVTSSSCPARDVTTVAPQAPEEPPAEKSSSALTAVDAWGLLVEQGTGVPSGMRPFLRAATVAHTETEGVVVIELPAGPGLERLEEPSARGTLQKALGELMKTEPKIVVRASGDGPPERISPEAVRNDRMKGLIKMEPRLQHAVDELDLELLD